MWSQILSLNFIHVSFLLFLVFCAENKGFYIVDNVFCCTGKAFCKNKFGHSVNDVSSKSKFYAETADGSVNTCKNDDLCTAERTFRHIRNVGESVNKISFYAYKDYEDAVSSTNIVPCSASNNERDYIAEFKFFINNLNTIYAKFEQKDGDWDFYFKYYNGVPCILVIPQNGENTEQITIIDNIVIAGRNITNISSSPLYSILCKKIRLDKSNCRVEAGEKNKIKIIITIHDTIITMFCRLYKNGNIQTLDGWQIEQQGKKTITAMFKKKQINDESAIPAIVTAHFANMYKKLITNIKK